MLLVRTGPDGLTTGELRQRQEIPALTLAFHLRGMVQVGLVTQERLGREVHFRPDFNLLNEALASANSECRKVFGLIA